MRSLLRGACLSATTAAFVILGPTWAPEEREAHALPKFDPPGIEGGGLGVDCGTLPVTGEIVGMMRLVGYPIIGFTVELDARGVKQRWGRGCGGDFVGPAEQFTWAIESQPVGSGATLVDDDTLAPRLRFDRAGSYQVSLTVCPGGCAIVDGGQTINIPTRFFGLTIEAVPSAPLAPETMPVLPTLPAAAKTVQAQNHCSFDTAVTGAQWWAVEHITTAADYRLLEGEVTRSRVSRRDTPMNHDSQDANVNVFPDPPYRSLFFAGSDEDHIEVEWETNAFPEFYRPTIHDRASVFGHWIYDCGHNGKTEIHPPVGIAVHRPRPIAIPSTETLPELGGSVGSNVYVPGIISDLFFSTRGGRLLDCSVDTGLKNADWQQGPNGMQVPACVPASSLDRIFVFNIYLPRNPQVTMARAGFSVPPVPLYVKESRPPDADDGPAPTFERVDTAEGVTYLRVTLDLRDYPETTYKRRIVAGWVLPAADNWGLSRWRLLLHRLNVRNDGDGSVRGDGDWRFWVNTNNAASEWLSVAPQQEWVRILHRDVHGVEDFGGVPWETALDAPRSLGPDLLRYPIPGALPAPRDYGILFHTTGYEADGFVDDDAGTILVSVPPAPGSYVERNRCTPSAVIDGLYYSGCVDYTAEFEVVAGPPMPPVTLSGAARALASAYVLSCPRGSSGEEVGECRGILAPPVEVSGFPLDAALEPGSEPIDISTVGPFRPGEREFALTEISAEEFSRIVETTRRTDPSRVDRLLSGMRSFVNEMLRDPSLALDADAELTMLDAILPNDLWTMHFGDIPRREPEIDLPKARMAGFGSIALPSGSVRVTETLLHCNAQRQPNSLTIRSGVNRFDLKLALDTRCTTTPAAKGDPSGPFIQEGRGIGRYNGAPAAVVQWRFVDAGEAGRSPDSASITITVGGVVVLQGSGELARGDFQAQW